MKTTVIYHSADFDGVFCREIARKFLPDAELIGWDFADAPLLIPTEGTIYILDLPVDRLFGKVFGQGEGHLPWLERVVWIDHHKSSIETHPFTLPGYRIDGVAACRLAWQWFNSDLNERRFLPEKQAFIDREVSEPFAVTLAGEYDIWDKRDADAEVFQFGLRSKELTPDDWRWLLTVRDGSLQREYDLAKTNAILMELLANGKLLQTYQQRNDAGMVKRAFMVEWEGLKFLTLTTARCNSLTFASRDVPETGHDALMGFCHDGKGWNFSLYHAKHNTGIDLSRIAVQYGGGGHRGACGFRCGWIPFCLPGSQKSQSLLTSAATKQ